LKVRLLGKLSLKYAGQTLQGLESSKVQELLAYLLLHRDKPHPRESLASLLWATTSTSQSKKYLRQALWQLQNALQEHFPKDEPQLLLIDPNWIRVNPDANLWLDVAELETAYKKAHGLQGWQLDAATLQALREAEKLYRGDLLLGWYNDWCLYARERFQNMVMAVLDKLMSYCEAHGEYETGLAYGTRILSFDRARERTHQRLMRLHYLAGDRTSALRQYEQCARALEEELSVKPAKRTQELYKILTEDGPLTAEIGLETSQGIDFLKNASANLPSVMDQLQELHWLLADVQRRVERDMEAIEHVIKSD
jgi:DNA-binding SARP family transcriptional activator